MRAIKINPQFENLQQSETFLNHIQKIEKEVEAKQNPFPVEVFPKAVQEIITDTNQCLNFPIDFIGASILYAVSVSIGNTHRVEIKKGWQENAVLYLSIVGRAGTNKSHPVSFALQPIEQRDNMKFQEYQNEKREYDNISSLTKKEREQQGYNEPVKPIWEQHLVTDFTPEALTDVHKFNKRGIGVYADELATWFKNFNRYNKGSEEQFWLSVWSGKAIRINRKTSEPTYITKPFISVIGTIQPKVLNELADNRTENGFLDRLLFVAPKNLKKPYWSETELNPVIFENWQTIVSRLLDLSILQDETGCPQPEVLRFTPEAKQVLFDWQRELTDQSNKPENEAIGGINAKIEMYAIRLALILQMIRYACNEDNKQAVGIEAVQGALKLVEYFKRTAIKVHSIVNNASPLDKLTTDKQNLYNELPDTFTTSEGVEVAECMGIAERTFKYFINNRDLFNNPKRGEYEKRI
ncbi:YfjI family protein [Aestuariivivens sediminicola]|uniref:YfjI family protein n=1 Tax=Aestuariivivens sediminicola TaxID=2913560 RepID=UPI001F59D50D|nr:YfjI family protein [Aestuariivivens sediminicola]